MKTIKLPIFEIVLELHESQENNLWYSGTISSNLHEDESMDPDLIGNVCLYNTKIDIIEAMILAHACSGIDVTNESYLNGIQTVVDKIQDEKYF